MAEPVSLTEMKNYLKLDNSITDDDSLIGDMITSARRVIENMCGRKFEVATITEYKDITDIENLEAYLKILTSPVGTITSITYYEDFSSTGEILDSGSYRIVDDKIYHEDGYWKVGRPGDTYKIIYTTSNAAEPGIEIPIMRLVSFWYNNRDEMVSAVNEAQSSQNYDTKIPDWLFLLVSPFHSGKGLI